MIFQVAYPSHRYEFLTDLQFTEMQIEKYKYIQAVFMGTARDFMSEVNIGLQTVTDADRLEIQEFNQFMTTAIPELRTTAEELRMGGVPSIDVKTKYGGTPKFPNVLANYLNNRK
jgi:hypothetical protein